VKVTAFACIVLAVNLGWYIVEHERQPYNQAGPWKELAELFDAVAHKDLVTQGVFTPNQHAFRLMTGYSAPMICYQYDPIYDHLVTRLDGKGLQPQAGAVPIVTIYPWVLYQLTGPMTRSDLFGNRDLSAATIPVSDE